MRKVGGSLSKYNIINEVFDTIGEIAKKSDFISAGLKDQDIYALCRQGYLERVKTGYYRLAASEIMTSEQGMIRGYIGIQKENTPKLVCCFFPPQWKALYGGNILMVRN